MRRYRTRLALAVLALATGLAPAATLKVGPGETYSTVQAAVNAAHAGDTITIDSGTYTRSAAWANINTANLTITGVGATRPVLDAAGGAISSKGIFVVGGTGNLTVNNLEFCNTAISDSLGDNAAGIRFESTGDLTVHGCCFHNNQDGILTDPGAGKILIEYSEFYQNGETNPANKNGYGETHNMYIGNDASFTLQYCWSHDANVGHLVKTRANVNYILYNMLTNATGTASYELQLTQGGTCYVIGNVIWQGPNTGNAAIVVYGGEGTNGNPYLYFVNNSVMNTRSGGTYIRMSNSVTSAIVQNNIFQGYGGETLVDGTYAYQVTPTGYWMTTNAGFADPNNYDFHLTAASTGAIDKGTTLAPGYNNVSLTPTLQYVHPCSQQPRTIIGPIDLGAYEFIDTTPPAAITNLAAPTVTGSAITLTWTAPSDPDSACTAYDIRYSTSNITAANFSSATQVTGAPAPAAPGTNQSMTVSGLSGNTPYYFAMKTSDAAPNWSAISNIVQAVTYKLGDINGDGYINVGDLQLLIAAWGSDNSGAWSSWNPRADLNGDGYVNVSDLQILVLHWGQ